MSSGDYNIDDSVYILFTTRAFATGIPGTLSAATVAVYSNVTATPVQTAVAVTESLNAIAGLNAVTLACTTANGYAAGESYHVVLESGSVDSVSVAGEVVGSFTLVRAAVLVPVTGYGSAIQTRVNFTPAITAGQAGGLFLAGTNAATTITAAAGAALTLNGQGAGAGIIATGGATGQGIHGQGGATSGAGLQGTGGPVGVGIAAVGGATSGSGMSAIAVTEGHGLLLTAAGTAKHGLSAAGAAGGASDGIKAVSGGSGVDIRGAITGDVTGNLSGSVDSVTNAVGSVTGAVGSVTGAVGSVTGAVGSVTAAITLPTIPTDWITADGIAAAAISAAELGDFSTTMKTSVQTAVDAAIDTAIAELGVGQPTATPTIRTALMLLYHALAQQTIVQTSGTDALQIYNSAGTMICKKLLTDATGDYTEARAVTP